MGQKMYLRKVEGARTARLPNGQTMTRADLPPTTTRRWVASRKAAVVAAVGCGLVSRETALKMYDLSPEEFDSWERNIAQHGLNGLKTTATQKYRQP